MNNPFIISSCKTYTTYSEFFIVSQNIIAFPHQRWLAAYVPTHHIRRHALTSSNCDRYMRSAKCTSTDRVIKCDDRPIPISGRSIGASLVTICSLYKATWIKQLNSYRFCLHCLLWTFWSVNFRGMNLNGAKETSVALYFKVPLLHMLHVLTIIITINYA